MVSSAESVGRGEGLVLLSASYSNSCSNGTRIPADLTSLFFDHYIGPIDPETRLVSDTGFIRADHIEILLEANKTPEDTPVFQAFAIDAGRYASIISLWSTVSGRTAWNTFTDQEIRAFSAPKRLPADALVFALHDKIEEENHRISSTTPIEFTLAPGQIVYIGHVEFGPAKENNQGARCGFYGYEVRQPLINHPGLSGYARQIGVDPRDIFFLQN